ncbi:CAF17-like 4Fe-4S cluster assembly/insertion protein YgfZ [Andreprevotia chitinilytica]|uniref:CAF17-like 4Fe-4S cluster assembly/insertion protein YgfZ n=1 Tax=Andreprevotia chitinilytica TaxID=396808 RepID=UPI0006904F5B|nr:folate-binding protein YgfZ [Andreprevotia chitinilytica]
MQRPKSPPSTDPLIPHLSGQLVFLAGHPHLLRFPDTSISTVHMTAIRSAAPGTLSEQFDALANGTIASPLSQYGLIRFSGEETAAFLNGQLSSDVRTLPYEQAQYSSYSTPKGRMQASFLVWRDGDDYLLQIAAELQTAIQKRLSMFVLRAKTKASDANADYLNIGIAGPKAADVLAKVAGGVPTDALAVLHGDALTVIALSENRYQLIARADQSQVIWDALQQAGVQPAGEDVWRLTEIRAGAPWVTAATQEEFVPQMANMELIGAVSFTKGCYPGQEIVARTQYLGKLKRRMFRVHIGTDAAAAGNDVYSPEMNGQASGKLLLAAPAPQGGIEALVVVQTASLEHGLHLGSVDGPALEVLALPYEVA